MTAARAADVELVRTLLAQGADVNLTSGRGQTPLMLAAVCGHEEIARMLLTAGADDSLKDALGLTARDWAERRGFGNIASLIEHTANITQPTTVMGRTRIPVKSEPNADDSLHENGSSSHFANEPAQPSKLLSVLRARAAQAHQKQEMAAIAETNLQQENAAQPGNFTSNDFAIETPKPTPVLPYTLPATPPAPGNGQRNAAAPAAYRSTGPLNIGGPEVSSAVIIDQPSARSWVRPVLWSLITVTFAGAAFLTYRFINRRPVPPPPAAATVVTKVQPALRPLKPPPAVTGDLAAAAMNVPDLEIPSTLAARISGPIDPIAIRVQVNHKGKVVSAHPVSGEPLLRSTATKAARQASFDPAKLPVKRKLLAGTITYTVTNGETAAPKSDATPATATSNAKAETADTDRPVTGDALAGMELDLPKADYPEALKRKGITGSIVVTVRVNSAGKVISWNTSKGDYQLRMAALKAAKKATFDPARLPAKHEVVGTLTYTFKS